jgi:hypothetical protein
VHWNITSLLTRLVAKEVLVMHYMLRNGFATKGCQCTSFVIPWGRVCVGAVLGLGLGLGLESVACRSRYHVTCRSGVSCLHPLENFHPLAPLATGGAREQAGMPILQATRQARRPLSAPAPTPSPSLYPSPSPYPSPANGRGCTGARGRQGDGGGGRRVRGGWAVWFEIVSPPAPGPAITVHRVRRERVLLVPRDSVQLARSEDTTP